MAARIGLDEETRGRLGIVTTELATNLVRHARDGEMIVRALSAPGAAGIELLAIDRGPGMANLEQCSGDGHSTGGTPGQGLGAIRRQSHEFDIVSTPGSGTVVMARLWNEKQRRSILDVGAVALPCRDEVVSGDGWLVSEGEERSIVVVIDGLGHGPAAAEAAEAALETAGQNLSEPAREILTRINFRLRSTRGAAGAVAELRRDTREIVYAGIGNVSGVLVTDARQQWLLSHNGTLGADRSTVRETRYPLPPGATLVMHTDGLQSQWRLDRYDQFARRRTAILAGLLYRDYRRGKDDVTVVAVREADPPRSAPPGPGMHSP
jgi:anti-sigma regulatory factor (Ser/Thr protein kinase)